MISFDKIELIADDLVTDPILSREVLYRVSDCVQSVLTPIEIVPRQPTARGQAPP